MRGSYMQSFWSISTTLSGTLAVSLAPLVTWTQTFSSLPLFTATEGSVIGFFAQYGSASRCNLPGVGALPLKSIEPSMVSAIAAAGSSTAAATASSLEQVISAPLSVNVRAATSKRIPQGQDFDATGGSIVQITRAAE